VLATASTGWLEVAETHQPLTACGLRITPSSTRRRPGSTERRFLTIGRSPRGRLLVVAYTEPQQTLRIMSAKRATRHERAFYEEG
jgi:uncharacterized DUF497 family protein